MFLFLNYGAIKILRNYDMTLIVYLNNKYLRHHAKYNLRIYLTSYLCLSIYMPFFIDSIVITLNYVRSFN